MHWEGRTFYDIEDIEAIDRGYYYPPGTILALAAPPAPLDVEPTRQEVDRMRRALAASVYSHDPDGAAVMAYEVAAAYQQEPQP